MTSESKLPFWHQSFPSWLSSVLIAVLTGFVLGALAGAFVYPHLMFESFNSNDENDLSAVFDMYRYYNEGVLVGPWIGAMFGLVFHLVRMVVRRRRSARASIT